MSSPQRIFWLALMLLSVSVVVGAETKSFVNGSLQQIVSAHSGKPFILSLWSRSCSHCREELTMLGHLMAEHPRTPIVLLSTDTIDEAADITKTLEGYGLGTVESWVFADSYIERLQYEIDNRWHGELPRTYLYEGNGMRKGYSGQLELSFLRTWLNKQGVTQR